MSFIAYKIKCKKCGHVFDTAFGIVGTTMIAKPSPKCPICKSNNLEGLKIMMHKRRLKGDKNI